jgi:hypothetical protein
MFSFTSEERRFMKEFSPAKLGLLLSLAAAPAYAQPGPPGADAPEGDAIRSSLTDLLAFATLGTVTTQEQAAQFTRSGDDFHVRLPLRGFLTPPGAAIDAVAHPLGDGVVDITSMTFPPAGTVESAAANAGTTHLAYSIGEQSIHARIDPSFVQPSSLAASLGAVTLHSDHGEIHSEHSADRYTADGTLSPEPAGLLTFASTAKATNWHLTAHGANGFATDTLARTLAGNITVNGLDRIQGTRLLAAARAMMGGAQTPAPGQPPGLSPEQRRNLRDVIDAAPGLLTHFQAEETMDGIRFTFAPAASGTAGRLRIDMAGDAANERLNVRMNLGMDDLAIASMPADTAAYVPHHFDMRPALAGVRIAPLMVLLRAATAPDADPAALQAQLTSLLADPDARIGIESLTFDAGPLRVTASARLTPNANGQIGGDIHVSATGMDELMAQIQEKPATQQALPMILVAKGLGRPDGGALVWDIVFGNGSITVNGIPFGQPAHKR